MFMETLKTIGTVINFVGGILLVYCFIPQIITLIKTKSPGNNSTQSWVIMTFGIACIGINQFICQIPRIQLIIQSINIVLSVVCTSLIVYYSKKDARL